MMTPSFASPVFLHADHMASCNLDGSIGGGLNEARREGCGGYRAAGGRIEIKRGSGVLVTFRRN